MKELLIEALDEIRSRAVDTDPMSFHGELIVCDLCGENGTVAGHKRGTGDRAIVHKPTCLIARLEFAIKHGVA